MAPATLVGLMFDLATDAARCLEGGSSPRGGGRAGASTVSVPGHNSEAS